MLKLSCFTDSPACVYPLSISHSHDQSLSKQRWVSISQQISAQSSPGWAQIQSCCWVCEEENLSQSVCWLGLSVWFAPCTGKAGSIDFIRHWSVGLSVCLSCIPDIPDPPPALCFLCLAGHHTTVSPKKVIVALESGAIITCTKSIRGAILFHSHHLSFSAASVQILYDGTRLPKTDSLSGYLSWQWTVMT